MSISIVVARYNESLSWTENGLFKDWHKYVYDKSGAGINSSDYGNKIFIEPLPNIGREAHTYLYHIVNYWDHLEDFVMFTQADFVYHGVELQQAHDKLKWIEQLYDGSADYAFIPLTSKSRPCGRWFVKDGICNTGMGLMGGVPALFREIFGEDPPEYYEFNQAAIFVVSRKLIHDRGKSFYENLLSRCSIDRHDKHAIGEIFAGELERLWNPIFEWRRKVLL